MLAVRSAPETFLKEPQAALTVVRLLKAYDTLNSDADAFNTEELNAFCASEEAAKVKDAQDFNKKLQDEITKLMLLAD